MWAKLLSFVAPYKLYIYAVVGALLVAGWYVDRKIQYNKGKDACILAQAKAQASYWEQRGEQLVVDGRAALAVEKTTSTNINARLNSRKAEVEKSNELDKNNPNGSCLYNDDELWDINDAIRQANS